MRLRTDLTHLPTPIRHELHRLTVMIFDALDETTKGRLSEQYRASRILTLILHGAHVTREWEHIAPGEAYSLLVVVNYPRLARSARDWRMVRGRLHRAWEHGEITRPVRLTIESLEGINRALMSGVPYFAAIADKGIALFQAAGLQLQQPRTLPAPERQLQGMAAFMRWHRSASDFLSGAAFYREQGNAPMAALMLHQACEQFYLCVLRSISLHAPRTHALDELREAAEALDARLRIAWPRETRFERRAFGCIRRAYIEARYSQGYRISAQELGWAFTRIEALTEQVSRVCGEHLASLDLAPSAPLLSAPVDRNEVAPSQPVPDASDSHPTGQITLHRLHPRFRWNRLIREQRFGRSDRMVTWLHRLSIGALGLSLFVAGGEAALIYALPVITERQPTPADPSAVLDFDIHADTILGAVSAVADRAGYHLKSNNDIWVAEWTGAYRAKATTFDALSDILYGSGLCPTIRDDVITVRYCDKTRPPVAAS